MLQHDNSSSVDEHEPSLVSPVRSLRHKSCAEDRENHGRRSQMYNAVATVVVAGANVMAMIRVQTLHLLMQTFRLVRDASLVPPGIIVLTKSLTALAHASDQVRPERKTGVGIAPASPPLQRAYSQVLPAPRPEPPFLQPIPSRRAPIS